MRRIFLTLIMLAGLGVLACSPGQESWSLENEKLRVSLLEDASVEVFDKTTATSWPLGSPRLMKKGWRRGEDL